MDRYILAVPRHSTPIDFTSVLKGIDNLEVKRDGLLRRVQVWATSNSIAEAKKRLPQSVLIEPVIRHSAFL